MEKKAGETKRLDQRKDPFKLQGHYKRHKVPKATRKGRRVSQRQTEARLWRASSNSTTISNGSKLFFQWLSNHIFFLNMIETDALLMDAKDHRCLNDQGVYFF